MRAVWKFRLIHGRVMEIAAGPGPVVLVGLDSRQVPSIWIECGPEQHPASIYDQEPVLITLNRRLFRVHATGEEIDAGMTHVGSFVDGGCVWHVYERVEA